MEALPKLLSHLSAVAPSWELLTQQIGVPLTQISLIKEAYPLSGINTIYTRFTRALDWWIKNHEKPVYESIIDALEEDTPVMNKALASKVRKFRDEQQGESFTVASTVADL